jgi:hypothetical protein
VSAPSVPEGSDLVILSDRNYPGAVVPLSCKSGKVLVPTSDAAKNEEPIARCTPSPLEGYVKSYWTIGNYKCVDAVCPVNEPGPTDTLVGPAHLLRHAAATGDCYSKEDTVEEGDDRRFACRPASYEYKNDTQVKCLDAVSYEACESANKAFATGERSERCVWGLKAGKSCQQESHLGHFCKPSFCRPMVRNANGDLIERDQMEDSGASYDKMRNSLGHQFSIYQPGECFRIDVTNLIPSAGLFTHIRTDFSCVNSALQEIIDGTWNGGTLINVQEYDPNVGPLSCIPDNGKLPSGWVFTVLTDRKDNKQKCFANGRLSFDPNGDANQDGIVSLDEACEPLDGKRWRKDQGVFSFMLNQAFPLSEGVTRKTRTDFILQGREQNSDFEPVSLTAVAEEAAQHHLLLKDQVALLEANRLVMEKWYEGSLSGFKTHALNKCDKHCELQNSVNQ